MNIAVTPGGDLAKRVTHLLLADGRVEAVGLSRPWPSEARTRPLSEFAADAVIGFAERHPYASAAEETGTPVFSPTGKDGTHRGAPRDLASALLGRLDADPSTAAWTEAGTPLREGPVVSFPPPLGRLNGTRTDGGLAVPVDGRWAGVRAGDRDGIATVDDRRFLEAIVLVARVFAYLEGEADPGPTMVREAAEAGLAFAATR